MADALAIVGLVAAIVQFADTGGRVLKRLNEFRSSIEKNQEFRPIQTWLPLFIDALKRTKQQAEDGLVSEQTAQALNPSVERCVALVKRLNDILARERPLIRDSKWTRKKKAVASVFNDKDVKEILEELKSLEGILTLHHVAGNSPQHARPSAPSLPQVETKCNTLTAKVVQQTPPLLVVKPARSPCFTVKFPREEDFVGREDILTEIDRRLLEGQHRVAIAGIGGVGKSQIAIEYCYRYRAAHSEANIFWVHGSNLPRFSAAYQEIARELALPGMDQPNVNIFQLVSAWLNCEANGPWLLVLDNVDDIETMFGSQEDQGASTALINHLPHSSRGAMIMTTRDQRIGERLVKRERPIRVMPYGAEDAKRLLQKSLRDDHLNDVEATALLEALDFLPLAISQAAAFMRENGVSLGSYLGSLEAGSQETKALLAEAYNDPGRDAESQNSVFQTWRVSFESIRQQSPRAAEILSLMAVLDRQAIPVRLLHRADERNVDFIKAIGTLKAFSLISEQAEGATFGMHRLVQLATQRWLELENLIEEWHERALAAASIYCSELYCFIIADWVIIPQVQVILSFNFTKESCKVQRAIILNYASFCDRTRGYFPAAHEKSLEAHKIFEELLDEQNPLRMEIGHNLGRDLLGIAQCDDSEELLRRVLDKREKFLGPNHPDTLLTMDLLAHTLGHQAKYSACEAMQQDVLNRSEKICGPDDQMTIRRVLCLSVLYATVGNYERAGTMRRHVLHATEKRFGSDHLETLWSLYGVACVYSLEGKYEVAEKMTRKVWRGYQKAVGLEHPHCLALLNSLVYIVESQGRWAEAEVLARQASDLHEKLLGCHHPKSLACRSVLATLLIAQEKLEAAEAIDQQVILERIERISRSSPPSVLPILARIGVNLAEQGKHEAGEALLRRALDGNQKSFGPENPVTLLAASCLASILWKRKQFDEAYALYEQAGSGLVRTLGPNHHSTVICVDNFASLRRNHPDFRIRIPARFQNLYVHILALKVVPSRRGLRALACKIGNVSSSGESDLELDTFTI